MSPNETSSVYFFPLPASDDRELDPMVMKAVTELLVGKLGLQTAGSDSWALKVHLGARGRPAAVAPDYAAAAASKLSSGQVELGDTLSITSEGLHTVADLLVTAQAKGYPETLQVWDDPSGGQPRDIPGGALHASGRAGRSAQLAAGLAEAAGLLVLNAVDTHPHLGFQGALAQLVLGCSDRQAKIALHRDIRPKVDTPLCAGCGSCLAVCIFDAIDLKSGRAVIDHTKCTGCGECLTVCHLAGIAAENPAALIGYQEQLAETAAALLLNTSWQAAGRLGFVNFLINLDRRHNRSAPRALGRPPHIGVLASSDPVALDQATWDLLNIYTGKDLAAWCGYPQSPGVLLEKTASWTACRQEYRLIEVASA